MKKGQKDGGRENMSFYQTGGAGRREHVTEATVCCLWVANDDISCCPGSLGTDGKDCQYCCGTPFGCSCLRLIANTVVHIEKSYQKASVGYRRNIEKLNLGNLARISL